MPARKVTYSLDARIVLVAEAAARRAGLSASAWMSRAARREAVRTGHELGLGLGLGLGDVATVEEQAHVDEIETAAAEAELRAAG